MEIKDVGEIHFGIRLVWWNERNVRLQFYLGLWCLDLIRSLLKDKYTKKYYWELNKL